MIAYYILIWIAVALVAVCFSVIWIYSLHRVEELPEPDKPVIDTVTTVKVDTVSEEKKETKVILPPDKLPENKKIHLIKYKFELDFNNLDFLLEITEVMSKNLNCANSLYILYSKRKLSEALEKVNSIEYSYRDNSRPYCDRISCNRQIFSELLFEHISIEKILPVAIEEYKLRLEQQLLEDKQYILNILLEILLYKLKPTTKLLNNNNYISPNGMQWQIHRKTFGY